jgi:hypothetical protein
MKPTLCVLIVLLLCSSTALGQLYEWVDDNGSVNFTDDPDRVPARYRKRVKARDETLKAEPKPAESRKPQAPHQEPQVKSGPRLYGGHGLSWWQTSYATRVSKVDSLKSDLARLKEEQLVARRKKVTLSRLMDRKALVDKTAEVADKENEVRAAEKDLADFRALAESSGLTADMLESGR